MTDLDNILRMIETVDPEDTAGLKEIEAAVFKAVIRDGRGPSDYKTINEQIAFLGGVPPYCTSRDALKAIRPEGWKRIIIQGFPCSGWTVEIYDGAGTPNLPTEELAELHAILQAINYERKTHERNI